MRNLASSYRGHEAAAALVEQLPPLPSPWSVRELCDRLAAQRQRELLLHPMTLSALPLGLWYFDGERDHIIFRAEATGYHRDHIILHEICHMLARHNHVLRRGFGQHKGAVEGSLAASLGHAMHNPFTDAQEQVAETFATQVLKQVHQIPFKSVSDFERRAANMFGGADC
jgi:hypothetical protein